MSPSPELVVQLTDPHLRPGDDSESALRRAVAAVAELEPRPRALLLTGDIVHDGTVDDYRRAREILAPLDFPVHPIPGNHDERGALREAFADHPGVAGTDRYIQYTAECGPIRLIACDTQKPGTDGGELDAERLEWIERELAREPGRPTIIAMHHPPILSGMQEFDGEIGLAAAERRALADAIQRAGGASLIVSGHIHLAIRGTLGATPVQVCPSTYLQAELDLLAKSPINLVPDPPGYAIHLLGADGELVSHVRAVDSTVA